MRREPSFDTHNWAEENFAGCPLGDTRRSRRLVEFGRQAADRPASSLPKIGEDWAGTRGIYRLLDCSQVDLSTVTAAHRRRVRECPGRFLVVSDTTHVTYDPRRVIKGAGPVGPRRGGKGFLLHSGLLVDSSDGSLVGLVGQKAHVRPAKKRGRQNAARRMKRWRESELWSELYEQVGQPPAGSEYIHVGDSAADNFECFCTGKQHGCEVVTRAGRLQRNVLSAEGAKMPLSAAMADSPEWGRYELCIPRGNGRKARTAKVRVRVRKIHLPVPRHSSPRVKQYDGGAIAVSAIRVEEIDSPPDVEPLQWILLTTLPVESFEDAWEIIGYYEYRWVVEEWHRALKQGCALETRQLQSADRLLPLAGVLSIVAVLLVQLKHAARCEPNRPAAALVPTLWLELLQGKGKIPNKTVTTYQFWRGVAKLGGFLGRRHDGEPGWLTIWRGWQELHTLAEGAALLQKHTRKCG